MSELIAGLPRQEFAWLCVITAAAGAVGFVAGFVALYRKRLMEDMPTSRVRSAHQGYVELEGTARLMPGPPIASPLTGTRCAWWSYTIQEKRQTGRNSRWVTIARDRSSDCFLLEDETGACVVDPDHAKVIPGASHTWYGNSSRPDRGPRVGGGFLASAFSRFRYSEQLLFLDAPLYALGGFRTQSGADVFDEQADLRELLAKWKHDPKMMALFDVNKDGAVDMKEWEAARRMALKKVRDEHVRRSVDTPDLNILARPRDRRPYILSGVTQHDLIRRHWMHAGAWLVLCAAGTGSFLYALVARGIL